MYSLPLSLVAVHVCVCVILYSSVCSAVCLQRGGESPSWASDVWSAACNVVLMITSQHPWEGLAADVVPYKVHMHCTRMHACMHTDIHEHEAEWACT